MFLHNLFFGSLALDVVDSGDLIRFFNGCAAKERFFKTFDDINVFDHASFSKLQTLSNFSINV